MSIESKRASLKHWKYLVEIKDPMSWPGYRPLAKIKYSKEYSEGKNFDPDNIDNFKYFVGEFVGRVLRASNIDMENMQEETEAFNSLGYEEEDMVPGYWKHLVQMRKGDAPSKQLVPPIDPVTEENKQKVYDAFMPAYRAIRESFGKRIPFFSWVFNHKEYTAERDTLKALKALMQGMTTDSAETFEAKYRAYKSEVPLSKEDELDIKTTVKQEKQRFAAERKAKKEEDKKIEQEVIDDVSFDESLDDSRISIEVDDLQEARTERIEAKPKAKEAPTKNRNDSLNI